MQSMLLKYWKLLFLSTIVVGPLGIYPSDPSKTWRGKDDMLPPELSLRPLASSVAVSGPYGGLASESVGM